MVDRRTGELSAYDLRTVTGGVSAILINVGPTRLEESTSLKMLGGSTIGPTILDALNTLAALGRLPR